MECEICNTEVKEDTKSHRVWHMNCFKCKECGKPLFNNFECHDGIFYCNQRCYKPFTSKSVSKASDAHRKFPYNSILTFSTVDRNTPLWIPQYETVIPQKIIPQKYEARGGVINLGPDYEYKMATLLALRLVCSGTEQFWLASNVRNVGAFDDIIIYISLPNEDPVIYMIQLKHQENPKNIDRQAFLASSGDFSILKYSSDIQNLSQSTTSKIYFVIYTNRDVDNHSILQANSDETFKFLETHGQHSKRFTFDFSKLKECSSLSEECQKTVLLFANQASVKDLDREIWREVHSIFKSKRIDVESIAKNLVLYVTNWARGNLDGHYLLTKEEVESKLFHLYFTSFQIDFNEHAYNYICSNDYSIWQEITSDKFITIINKTDESVVQYLLGYLSSEVKKYCSETVPLWSTILSQDSYNIFYENNTELTFLMSKICSNKTRLTLIDIYQCLCVLRILPLILETNNPEELAHILSIKQQSFRIIVLCGCDFTFKEGFTSLKDLCLDKREKVLSRQFLLQGRKATLSDCIDDSLYEQVKVCDIIKILNNTFHIGRYLMQLPESFVDIKITKTFLKSNITQTCDDCFVIDNRISEECKMEDIPIHYISYYDNNHLAWKYSQGSTKNLEKYMVEIEYDLKNGVDDNNFFDKTVLVSAPPGMGKSVLMTYVAQTIPTTKWVVRIDLNDHQQYFKSEYCVNVNTNALYHLEYFKEPDCSTLQTAMFNKFIDTKNVVVLLDGFDEVSITHKEAVTNIARSLQNGGFQIWLTTRPVMKRYLEDEFKVRSITIKPFTPDNQAIFLTKYFCANNPDLDGYYVAKFVLILITSANKHLNYGDEDFTGIPLQITLLGNVFNEDCRKYVLSLGSYAFNKNFDLLYLYQNFVDKKLDILYEKFGGAALDARALFTEHHSQFALRVLFPSHLLKDLQDKKTLDSYYKVKESKMLLMQREGIIVIDENFVINFTHRTYAEYLAANWIASNITNHTKLYNLAQVLHKQRFTDSYKFLFRIFDQIIVRNCPLHTSIVNAQDLKVPYDDGKDSIGRNVLHLVALYSPQFPLRNYFKHIRLSGAAYYKNIVADQNVYEVEEMNDKHFKKDSLGYNPLDYALENRALTFADKLCSRFSVEININIMLRLQYLEYCACFKYISLFKFLLSYSLKKDVLLKYNICQSLKDYCQFYILYDASILDNIDENFFSRIITMDLSKNDYENIDDGNTPLHLAVLHNKHEVVENNIDSDFSPCNQSGNTPLDFAFSSGNDKIAQMLLAKGAVATVIIDRDTTVCTTNVSHHWILDKIACDILVKRFHENYNINNQDAYGNTPLHVALKWDKLDVANLLILMGADASMQNIRGETALHIASIKGFSDILCKLLPLHSNVQNFSDETPLHLAVLNGKVDVVKILITNKANANLVDSLGNTPLHLTETVELAEMLLDISNLNVQNNLGDTPLHVAAYCNRVVIVNLLVAYGANINAQNFAGETPLHLATQNGNECVENLINAGATVSTQNTFGKMPLHYAHVKHIHLLCNNDNINTGDFNGNTPLHVACYSGQVNVINKLIKIGADPLLTNNSGKTPFHCAVEAGHTIPIISDINMPDCKGNTPLHLASSVNLMENLIENGADINARNNSGATPLHCAISLNKWSIFERFVEVLPLDAQDCDGNTALHLAVRDSNIDCINVLIRKNIDINKQNKIGKTALHFALNVDVLNCLVDNGALVNVADLNGNTPLHTASFNGKVEIVAALLRKGAQVNCINKTNRTPLHLASAEGHLHTIQELINNKALINFQDILGNVPLHRAVWNYKVVEYLTLNGANVNSFNSLGETPLHYACYEGHPDIVKKLLKCGADVNAQDTFGDTPLHFTNENEIVEVLLRNYASVKLKNKKGESALHVCTSSEVAKILILNDINVDEKSESDNTPLHYASQFNRISVLDVLLGKGVDVNSLNKEGKTPLYYAFRFQYYDIINKLIEANADINLSLKEDNYHIVGYLLCKKFNFNMDMLLHAACTNLLTRELVEQLLKAGHSINQQNEDGNTPLHICLLSDSYLYNGSFLIANGADVNIANKKGETCIHLAAHINPIYFEQVLNNASNINAQNGLGETPLHIASKCGESHNVYKLILRQCDINAETYSGETPLFYASTSNIRVLIDHGANVNHCDKNGNTPLHTALLQCKQTNIISLISAGADVNARNKMQQTPLHLVVALWDNEHLISLLIDSGADINAQDSLGNTALHIACTRGFFYSVAKLIESKANMNIQNNRRDSPLHSCFTLTGYYNIIELLASSGANVNLENEMGELPLNIALRHKYMNSIEILKKYNGIANKSTKFIA